MTNQFINLYSKEVMKHFRKPKNLGIIKNPDGESLVGNPVCGDVMKFYVRIEKRGKNKKEEYIKDVKFQTLGCAAAIATSSMMTSLVKGKSLYKAQKITKDFLVKTLGGLPKIKLHCSVLADKAFKMAINDYKEKKYGKLHNRNSQVI